MSVLHPLPTLPDLLDTVQRGDNRDPAIFALFADLADRAGRGDLADEFRRRAAPAPSAPSSAAAAVPGLGWGAVAAKWGRRGVKAVAKGADAAATAGKVAAKNADTAAKAGKELGWVATHLKPVNWVAEKIVHGGIAKISTKLHDDVARALNKVGFNVCFTGDTPLLLEDGRTILAKDLEVGVKRLSRDEYDHEGVVCGKEVEEVFRRWGPVWTLTVKGRTIESTPEHPFYVLGKKWVPLNELQVGDAVRLVDGWGLVEAVADTGRLEFVYNCRVADYHTYFVGDEEWGFAVWVHNANPKYLANEIRAFRKQHGLAPVTLGEGSFKGTVSVIRGKKGATIGVNSELSLGRKVFRRQKLSPKQIQELESALAENPLFTKASTQLQGNMKTLIRHGEATSLYKAWIRNGRKPLGEVTIYADRTLCTYACQPYLHLIFKKLGVTKLTVFDRNRVKFVGTQFQAMTRIVPKL